MQMFLFGRRKVGVLASDYIRSANIGGQAAGKWPSGALGRLQVNRPTTPYPRLFYPTREDDVQVSVLEAIREGMWDYEPKDITRDQYSATRAMPGTRAKLDVLAMRAEQGLPLWHDEDRLEYDDGKDHPPEA